MHEEENNILYFKIRFTVIVKITLYINCLHIFINPMIKYIIFCYKSLALFDESTNVLYYTKSYACYYFCT